MKLVDYTNVLIRDTSLYNKNYSDIFTSYKKRVYCQLGEDGIIEKIFDIIGTTNKYYVEFGGWDGVHLSNTANLRINKGWSGLLLEGDKEKVLSTKNRIEINLHSEWLTKSNINDVFAKYNVPKNLDFLSVDIDGDDYYIWKALSYTPRVVVVETNPGITNEIPLTIMEGKSSIYQSDSNYFGANLHAFIDLAQYKGYTFLSIDDYNAFFVIDSEFPKFGITKMTKEETLKKAFIPDNYWRNRSNYSESPRDWVDLSETLL